MTVEQELNNRNRCRYGLRGVKVSYCGQEYDIEASEWNKDSKLMLYLAEVEKLVPMVAAPAVAEEYVPLITYADIQEKTDGLKADASKCTLLSEWKCVCCPSRKKNIKQLKE